MDNQEIRYDIAIIGTGIGGSTLATVLARQGLKVIVFEAGAHPRFTIGESMILETSEVMRALAEYYDVPEMAYYSSENYTNFIGTQHGVKRHFSFLHHTPGQRQDPRQSLQAVIPKLPVADLILKAHKTGDYSAAAFAPLETLTLRYMHMHDQLVAGSLKSWSHYKLWQAYSVLWLLGAYLEYLKLTVTRLRAEDRADYLAQFSGLSLAGGGFSEFFILQEKIDALIDQVNPDDEADVERTVAQMHALFGSFKWLSSAFRDLLAGKNHLPNNKLRVNLLNQTDGFFGDGVYRDHFFGDASTLKLIVKAVRKQSRYSVLALDRQRRTRARLAAQSRKKGNSRRNTDLQICHGGAGFENREDRT